MRLLFDRWRPRRTVFSKQCLLSTQWTRKMASNELAIWFSEQHASLLVALKTVSWTSLFISNLDSGFAELTHLNLMPKVLPHCVHSMYYIVVLTYQSSKKLSLFGIFFELSSWKLLFLFFFWQNLTSKIDSSSALVRPPLISQSDCKFDALSLILISRIFKERGDVLRKWPFMTIVQTDCPEWLSRMIGDH